MAVTLRVATPDDATAMHAIYAPIVQQTAISFETVLPTIQEMQQRISDTLLAFPWLVCEQEGEVVGYVYGSKHRTRAAYQWSVDVSVYIHARARRSGMGRALYTSLFRLLALQGFYNCYAGITLPNPPSVGLHETLGFMPVGIYRHVGYKLGAWHDVGWWQLTLQPHTPFPAPPIAFRVLQETMPAWEAALAAGVSLLRVSPVQ